MEESDAIFLQPKNRLDISGEPVPGYVCCQECDGGGPGGPAGGPAGAQADVVRRVRAGAARHFFGAPGTPPPGPRAAGKHGRRCRRLRRTPRAHRYNIGGKDFSVEQVVVGVFSFYCVLGFVGTRGKKKEEAPAAAPAATSGEIMSFADEGFDEWAASPANMKLWEDSVAEMK